MNFAIFGAGAWGTAFAIHLTRLGHTVTLVPRRMEQAMALAAVRENTDYLPGFKLAESLQIGFEPGPVLMEADVVLLACPMAGLRGLCESLRPHLGHAWRKPVLLALCKGLEQGTLLLPAEVIRAVLPGCPCGVISGPSFAHEVAASKPTAVVFASDVEEPKTLAVQEAVSSPALRVYRLPDVRGVELGGCLKNIYAIGAGICDGLKLGDNAKAAYLTRSLHEMVRLGVHLGGQHETFYGLSGFGDLVATCTGPASRNRSFGEQLASGKAASDLIGGRRTVVEGYHAAAHFRELCRAQALEPPILLALHAILYGGKNPQAALHELMTRELKSEY